MATTYDIKTCEHHDDPCTPCMERGDLCPFCLENNVERLRHKLAKMKEKKLDVIITVRGGVAEVFKAPNNVKVSIWDYDNVENGYGDCFADIWKGSDEQWKWECPVCEFVNLADPKELGQERHPMVMCAQCDAEMPAAIEGDLP